MSTTQIKKTLSVDYSYREVQSENDTSLESAPSNFRCLDSHRLCTVIELSKNYHFRKRNFQGGDDFRKRLQSHTACQWRRTSWRMERTFYSPSAENSTKIFDKLKFRTKSQMQSAKKSSLSKLKSFSPFVVSEWRRWRTHNHRRTDTTVRPLFSDLPSRSPPLTQKIRL